MKTLVTVGSLVLLAWGAYRAIFYFAGESARPHGATAQVDQLRSPEATASSADEYRTQLLRNCETNVQAKDPGADATAACACSRGLLAAVPDTTVLRWIDYHDLAKVQADPEFIGFQQKNQACAP